MLRGGHDEIVAGNVAEVELNSTPEALQATLRATVSEAATRCNHPIARNVACNVVPCGRAFTLAFFSATCVKLPSERTLSAALFGSYCPLKGLDTNGTYNLRQ